MRGFRQWGAAAVAAAFAAGGAIAQIAPQLNLPQAGTLPVPMSPGQPVPIAAPPVPIAVPTPIREIGTPLPVQSLPKTGLPPIATAPLAEPEALLGPTTNALPKLISDATRLIVEGSEGLQPTKRLLPPSVAPLQAQPPGPLGLLADSGLSPDALLSAREQRLQQLVREEALRLETDGLANPVVRGKLLVLEPNEDVLNQLRLAGFRPVAQLVQENIGIRAVELAVPAGLSALEALRRLQAVAPNALADFDHIFEPAGGVLAPSAAAVARRQKGGRLLIGMVDGGVAAHSSLSRTAIEQKAFSGALRATGHGTAVASLIAGSDGAFRGAASGTSLAVADVYGGSRAAGSASAIVRGLGWLVSRRPTVINISLTGPPNRLLAAAIKGVQAHNIKVVAAVGNDGPASPPQYPASYPGVIAITGVDARGRALPEAGNAAQIHFAAPGADMAAAQPGRGYAQVRGTSFAAPLAAGRLALLGSTSRLAAEARPGKGRIGRGIVCGPCRTDPARVPVN